MIRPFIENDYSSNKRFIDTFSIPEFRSFEIDYSTTRSKALQILNDNYHNTSFETKVKILRDQVLLEKLEKANEDFEKQLIIIENQIAIENQILTQQKTEAVASIKQIVREKEMVELEKSAVEKEKNAVEKEKNIAIIEIESKNSELKIKVEEIDNLKYSFEVQSIEQQLEHKSKLVEIIEKEIIATEKRLIPIIKIINNNVKNHKFYLALIPVIFFAIIFFLIDKLTWNIMEQYTYILSALALLIGYIYFAIKGESLDPHKYFEHYKNGITSNIYREFDFDNVELESQKNKLNILRQEINKLNEELKLRNA